MKCKHGHEMFVVLDEVMGKMWVNRFDKCWWDEYFGGPNATRTTDDGSKGSDQKWSC